MSATPFSAAFAAVKALTTAAQGHPQGLIRSSEENTKHAQVIDDFLCVASLTELSMRLPVLASHGLWICRLRGCQLPRWEKRLSLMQQVVGMCPALPAPPDANKPRKRPAKAELSPVVRVISPVNAYPFTVLAYASRF